MNELDDKVVLVIHSGSRNLGKQIAEHYQNRAYDELINVKDEKDRIIAELIAAGRQSEIQKALSVVKKPKSKRILPT